MTVIDLVVHHSVILAMMSVDSYQAKEATQQPLQFVDPEYRGQGIGRLLLNTCHALYPHTRLDLISTEQAIPFYQATGFRYVGEGLRKSYR